MKKQWKIGIFALLFAFVLVATMQITADAAAIEENDIIIDYIYETMTVNTEEDTVIYYTDSYHTDLSRWDACEVRNGKAVFDISWVNEEKTVRLYLKGDKKTEVVSINLTWEENFGVKFFGTLLETDITEVTKWKEVYKNYPNFSDDTGYFIFTLEENKRDNYYFDLDTIQWRKGSDGAWREFKELDLKEMNIRGIKLEFRIRANNEQVEEDDDGVSLATVLTDKGTRASTVAKVTLAKLGNAPEIIINPDIITVDVRNGQEFSLDKKTWTLIPTYSKKLGTDDYLVDEVTRANAISPLYTNQRITSLLAQMVLNVPENTEMTPEGLGENFVYKVENGEKVGVIIYVREAGTEKKAASLIKEVVIPFAQSGMSKALKEDFSIYHVDSKTGTGGIACENISSQNSKYPNGEGVKYQIAILTPEDYELYKKEDPSLQNVDVSKLKWTSVKPGRMLKLANKRVEEGSYILYRIAGENGNLPSTYLISDEVRYDRITYVGFTSYSSKRVGETLEAVVSTNVNPDSVTYKWERYVVKPGEVVDEDAIDDSQMGWAVIEDASSATYELKETDKGCYIRVTAISKTDEKNTKTGDMIGPIKEAEKK